MKKNNNTAVTAVQFKQKASKVFGADLWVPIVTLALGAVASNTDETPLSEDADIRKLAAPALFYQKGKFGLQLVLKYDERTWSYAHLMHDKDGDPIISENHTYDLKDVQARQEFAIPGTDSVIAKGYELTKAFVA